MLWVIWSAIDAVHDESNGLTPQERSEKGYVFSPGANLLTSSGVAYILNLYARNARILRPDLIPEKVSPHTLRHSKAMHLLQAGVNLIYIRDIMDHVSIQTTEVYARADSKQKREALEAAYIKVIPSPGNEGIWEKDSKLKEWLKNFTK